MLSNVSNVSNVLDMPDADVVICIDHGQFYGFSIPGHAVRTNFFDNIEARGKIVKAFSALVRVNIELNWTFTDIAPVARELHKRCFGPCGDNCKPMNEFTAEDQYIFNVVWGRPRQNWDNAIVHDSCVYLYALRAALVSIAEEAKKAAAEAKKQENGDDEDRDENNAKVQLPPMTRDATLVLYRDTLRTHVLAVNGHPLTSQIRTWAKEHSVPERLVELAAEAVAKEETLLDFINTNRSDVYATRSGISSSALFQCDGAKRCSKNTNSVDSKYNTEFKPVVSNCNDHVLTCPRGFINFFTSVWRRRNDFSELPMRTQTVSDDAERDALAVYVEAEQKQQEHLDAADNDADKHARAEILAEFRKGKEQFLAACMKAEKTYIQNGINYDLWTKGYKFNCLSAARGLKQDPCDIATNKPNKAVARALDNNYRRPHERMGYNATLHPKVHSYSCPKGNMLLYEKTRRATAPVRRGRDGDGNESELEM